MCCLEQLGVGYSPAEYQTGTHHTCTYNRNERAVASRHDQGGVLASSPGETVTRARAPAGLLTSAGGDAGGAARGGGGAFRVSTTGVEVIALASALGRGAPVQWLRHSGKNAIMVYVNATVCPLRIYCEQFTMGVQYRCGRLVYCGYI